MELIYTRVCSCAAFVSICWHRPWKSYETSRIKSSCSPSARPADRQMSSQREEQRRDDSTVSGDVRGCSLRRWWSLRLEECTPLTAPSSPPSVPWRVIKTDDSDGVPSGSTVSTAQPFCAIIYPTPPPSPPSPRSNSALITASSIHQRIDGRDRRCGTH